MLIGVVAVGQRDDRLRLDRALVEERDAEADRIAEGRARPGHADDGLAEQRAAQPEIGRERDEREWRVAEYDHADAIALSPCEEVVEHFLYRRQPIDGLARLIDEVLGVHRAREIDEEEQIAGRHLAMKRRLDPLRPA